MHDAGNLFGETLKNLGPSGPSPSSKPMARRRIRRVGLKALADASEESLADDQLPAAIKQKYGAPATAPADLAGTAAQIREAAQFHASLHQHGMLPAAEDSKYGLLVLMRAQAIPRLGPHEPKKPWGACSKSSYSTSPPPLRPANYSPRLRCCARSREGPSTSGVCGEDPQSAADTLGPV